MIWDGINQRKFPRVSYKCRIHVTKGLKDDEIETLTENIGAGGICVVLEKEFKLFENVSLEVYLKDNEEPIRTSGTVCWVVKRHPMIHRGGFKFDTGIEFKDMPEKDRGRISQCVENILHSEA